MKTKLLLCLLLTAFFIDKSFAQKMQSPTSGVKTNELKRNFRTENDVLPFDPKLKPFYHGVASGDPLADRVIIWTRVTPEAEMTTAIPVKWKMATNPEMTDIVKEGELTTDAARDFTVKTDVTGLEAGKTYYFMFTALGKNSTVGRTKTTPRTASHLRFAVVSCQNYEGGYFNAYAGIAARNDLDAVIHLGDYIYEYGAGVYGIKDEKRKNVPDKEVISLADYRTRYSLYRLDENLRKAHQQHPFITIWDDHESANDSYKDGAENHNQGEGSWEVRKQISKQVYAEWMPIRGNAESIYRTISYGNLADLIMIDTRLEGRDEQINDVTKPALYSPTRTLLGAKQKEWFLGQMKNSKAKWKIIGNQIIFSEFNVGWAGALNPAFGTPEQVESTFLDIWDGYPAERDQVIDYIKNNKINNVVWLTGDFHCSFAFDVAKRPSVFSPGNVPDYNPADGSGSVAVEFATPSISSANFDENIGAVNAATVQAFINKPFPENFPNIGGINPNPHMKNVDLIRHGYFILDLTETQAQADWFFVQTILEPKKEEGFQEGWFTLNNQNRLKKADSPAKNKTNQDKPAPDEPIILGKNDPSELVVFGIYPNPAADVVFVNYALNRPEKVRISLFDNEGKEVLLLKDEPQNPNNYTFAFSLEDFKAGVYHLVFYIGDNLLTRKIVKM